MDDLSVILYGDINMAGMIKFIVCYFASHLDLRGGVF